VGGRGIKAYPSKVNIKFADQVLEVRCYFIESEVAPLLGRTDVWDHFSLLFDNQDQRIVLKKVKEASVWMRFLKWLGF
jgi:hypothetical protein